MELTHLPKLSLFSNIVLNNQQQVNKSFWVTGTLMQHSGIGGFGKWDSVSIL